MIDQNNYWTSHAKIGFGFIENNFYKAHYIPELYVNDCSQGRGKKVRTRGVLKDWLQKNRKTSASKCIGTNSETT